MGPLQRFLKWTGDRFRQLFGAIDGLLSSSWFIISDAIWQSLAKNREGKDGISLLLGLTTFALTQGGAIGFTARYTDNRWLVVGLFGALAAFTILAVLFVLRFPDDEQVLRTAPGTAKHYFDPGTIAFGYWTMAISMTIPSVLISLVLLEVISPPTRRIPFDRAQIECAPLAPTERPGQPGFSSLLGRQTSLAEVREGNRVFGTWLGHGGKAVVNHIYETLPTQLEELLQPLNGAQAEALPAIVANVVLKYRSELRTQLEQPANDGLYAVRQKEPFSADFESFRCRLRIEGAEIVTYREDAADWIGFLVQDDDDGRAAMRQVYFDWDQGKGILGRCKVTPNRGETLVFFVYLQRVTESLRATIEVTR